MNANPSPHPFLDTPTPADLGPGPRAGVLSENAVRALVEQGGEVEPTYLALALLWHDHHEPAHELAQAIETPEGSYVHAILHRREPDYWNSKYWFRRVGRHPVYAELGRRVRAELISAGHESLANRLTPGGQWDPMVFVDLCEAAAGAAGEARNQASLLRSIQQLEFAALAEHLAP